MAMLIYRRVLRILVGTFLKQILFTSNEDRSKMLVARRTTWWNKKRKPLNAPQHPLILE